MKSTINIYKDNKETHHLARASFLRTTAISLTATFTAMSACLTPSMGTRGAKAKSENSHQHATAPLNQLKPYGVYTLTKLNTTYLLGVSGDIHFNEKYKAGQSIKLASGHEAADWQKWYIRYYSTVGKEKYYSILNVFSGKQLSALSNSAINPLVQTRGSGQPTDQQLWRFVFDQQAGAYRIFNKKTGLVLGSNGQHQQVEPLVTLLSKNQHPAPSSVQWRLQALPATAYRDEAVVGFFERNQPSLGSVAFDQGNSIPLNWGPNKGKVLWVTQDAWDGRQLKANGQFDCKDFFSYRNSMLLQPSINDLDPTHTLNIQRPDSRQHKPKQICDVLPTAEYAWPAAGIEIGRYVYIQCSEGDGLGPPKSQSLYQLTENKGLQWQVKRLTPKGMTSEHQINYSAGMVQSPDGFVYVFGFRGKSYGYALNLHVARFHPERPLDWSFWNGATWIDTPTSDNRARVATGKATVSVAYLNGKYIMMTMDQGFVCDSVRNIYLATSNSPTGPFTPLIKVYTINEYLYGKYARYYTPVIHPAFTNGHRELLLTYCLNFSGCAVPDCKDGYLDPYFYRIKGIRVPYDLIGL